MAFELTTGDVNAIVQAVRNGGLENVLLAVGFACQERAKTLGGAANDQWTRGRSLCNEAADRARELGL
jgi:hypothetical protein